MYLNFEVEIPTERIGISRKSVKGLTYFYYEHGRRHYLDKGYTVSQRTFIGKQCGDNLGRVIPNGNYLKFLPDAKLPDELPITSRGGCLRIGTNLVIKKIIDHYKLDEDIKKIPGKMPGFS